MKLEIDDLERRAIERSLAERRSRLIEKAGDTTLTPARRQASYRELSAIASVLRKLLRSGSPSSDSMPSFVDSDAPAEIVVHPPLSRDVHQRVDLAAVE